MADIICRWRNGTPQTVMELVNSMPHTKMSNENFRAFMQNSIWGKDFFRTPYQLACQLGLYYESDDGYYYPRFDHNINESEAKDYLEFWMPRYYVPNPYVGKHGFNEIDCPTYMLYELYKYTKEHPNCKYSEAYKAIFKEDANNNTDIVKNYINNFSKVLRFDNDGRLSITDVNPNEIFYYMDRNDKKSFFDNFTKNNRNNSPSPLQTIFYGTPGSGKSHKVKELVKESYFDEQEQENFVFRTTFHPDSDYASFVGCYKPNSKNKSLLNGNNYTESQLLARFFDSKEGDNKKARYLYEYLINIVDIRNLNLDANIIAEKLKEKGFDKTAYVGEANCMYHIYNWLKEDGYLIDSKISYEFCPQAFTKAYVKAWQNPGEPVYLIIEEINRGNCAQIFGDLFQLLDRKDGVSEYPIDADNDLKDYLEKELGVGHNGIANGKLRLPSNLNILATMNTSDQSLFPMDSAFKRRWDWECVPVDYENVDSAKFVINIDGKDYLWHDFLKNVNARIKKATDSEDKQMGNFFITENVTENQFVNKVMFYLWNDICKEEFGSLNNFFRNYIDEKKSETEEFSFNDLFTSDKKKLLSKFMEYIEVKSVADVQPEKSEEESE